VAGDAPLSLIPWRYADAAGLRIANLPHYSAPAFTIIVERTRIASIIETLRDRGAAAGVGAIAQIGAETIEVVRVEHGIARVGIDTNDKTIAL